MSVTPLPVAIQGLLADAFGMPAPGAQADEIAAAVAKLVGLGAQQRAFRDVLRDRDARDAAEGTSLHHRHQAPVLRRGH
jgi:hypothetical protein